MISTIVLTKKKYHCNHKEICFDGIIDGLLQGVMMVHMRALQSYGSS